MNPELRDLIKLLAAIAVHEHLPAGEQPAQPRVARRARETMCHGCHAPARGRKIGCTPLGSPIVGCSGCKFLFEEFPAGRAGMIATADEFAARRGVS